MSEPPTTPADRPLPTTIAALDGGADMIEAAVRVTQMPMIVTDARAADHPIIFANDAFCKMSGYERHEILGRNCRFLQGPATDPGAAARIRQALTEAAPIELDICNHRKDGSMFWNHLVIAPIIDASGALTHFYGKQMDVTVERQRLATLESDNLALEQLADQLANRGEAIGQANARLQAEIRHREQVEQDLRLSIANAEQVAAALREREAHLESVLATIPDAMIIIDAGGIIQSFSAGAERQFGYRAQEAIGQNVKILMPPGDRERHDEYLERYARTGEKRIIGVGRVVVGMRRDGSRFPMELSVGEVILGAHRAYTGFVRDLTERETAQRRLNDLQSELVHISRITSIGEMASTLAHELNQPLTAATSYLNGCRRLLENPGSIDLPLLHDAVAQAAEQTLRAGQIIRQMRQFVARGTTQRQGEHLGKVIEEVSALALLGTQQDGIHVTTALDPRVDIVEIDKIQIQQVLLNLIRNAVEAMRGSVRRELTIATALADGMVELSVTDSGPGIAPDIAANLFRPFVTNKPQGLGVGLSISRSIVEAHGGAIWAVPNPAGGTSFRFTIKIVATAGDGHGDG